MAARYLSFVKIEHTLFSLPVVFAGALLAAPAGPPGAAGGPGRIFWICCAVLGARCAGFGLNRILDRELDARNPRTSARELPAGKISLPAAWAFVAASSLLFVASSYRLSPLCLLLSPIPLALFFAYPFLKRFTVWTHLGLGLAWGTAPIGGWLAARPVLSPFSDLAPVLWLAAFCVFWVAGFDVIYALLDESFDRREGLYSMPARLGTEHALRAARAFHFLAVLALGTLVQTALNRPLSFFLLALAGALLLLSHWKVARGPLTPPVIDFAFFKVNAALAFVVFFIVLGGQLP